MFDDKRNKNNPLVYILIKNTESEYLVEVLLSNEPIEWDNGTGEEAWPRDIIIILRDPIKLRLWIEIELRFECKILGKAIIFFKSWYLNIEPDTIITPNILQDIT